MRAAGGGQHRIEEKEGQLEKGHESYILVVSGASVVSQSCFYTR